MAKVKLIGLEQSAAYQIGRALDSSFHHIEQLPANFRHGELFDADIVFAAGEDRLYLPLLKRVRAERPGLPFVVVTRNLETSEWLDALEAGATDYCSAPFEPRHLNWMLQSALVGQSAARTAAA